MFILKKGHRPGVYVPLRALFLVSSTLQFIWSKIDQLIYMYAWIDKSVACLNGF